MKNLEEVKEEVSFKYNFLSWDDLMDYVYSKAYEDPEKYYNEVAKRYAQSVAEDLRERIADEARLEPNGMLLQVDKQSILDTEIILP